MKPDILIARIRKAHGVKGEVIASAHTFDPSRFSLLKTVYIGDDLRPMTIEQFKNAHLGVILKFREVTTRDEAESLKGMDIYINEVDRLPLPDTEAYIDELIGMTVIDNESGKTLGTVSDVLPMPSGNVLVIQLQEGSERLVNQRSPEFIGLSRSKRVIRISLMEEL